MQDACHALYESTYKSQSLVAEEEEEETDFAQLAMKKLLPKQVKDEYKDFIEGGLVSQAPANLFMW